MLDNSIECTDSHRVKMLPKVTVFDYKESEVCVFKLNYMNYSKKPKISKLLYWDLGAFTNNAGCYMDCIYQGGYGPLPYKIHRNISERSFALCSFKCRYLKRRELSLETCSWSVNPVAWSFGPSIYNRVKWLCKSPMFMMWKSVLYPAKFRSAFM